MVVTFELQQRTDVLGFQSSRQCKGGGGGGKGGFRGMAGVEGNLVVDGTQRRATRCHRNCMDSMSAGVRSIEAGVESP